MSRSVDSWTSGLQLKKRPQQRRAQLTLDSLLEAGANVLREFGYSQFSVERIAGDCGVAVGTFYEYFAHKEALIAELRRRHNQHIAQVLEQALLSARDLNPQMAVRCVVEANVRLHLEDPALHRMLTVILVDVGVEPDDRDATTAFLKSSDNGFADYLAAHLGLPRSRAVIMANTAFVIAESLTHAAIIDRNLQMEPPALIDEISAVLIGYFQHASDRI